MTSHTKIKVVKLIIMISKNGRLFVEHIYRHYPILPHSITILVDILQLSKAKSRIDVIRKNSAF